MWLEDVHGARATQWVDAENAKTLNTLQSDSHFSEFYSAALRILGYRQTDEIEYASFADGQAYNFIETTNHGRGMWRTTTLAEYKRPRPSWRTLLDLQQLVTTEGKNWVWGGADCSSPSHQRCLITLSEGGEDAVTIREFDLVRREFVSDGFVLPRGKQTAVWADENSILVSREWEPGDVTASSYPYVVKRVSRGQPLSAAVEVFRGTKADVGVRPFTVRFGEGSRALFVRRAISALEGATYLIEPNGARRVAIPLRASLGAHVGSRQIIRLGEEWKVGDSSFPAGSLLWVALPALLAAPEHLSPALLDAPGPNESSRNVLATRNSLLVAYTKDVEGQAYAYTPSGDTEWIKKRVAVPDDLDITLGPSDPFGQTASVFVSGFLTPLSLMFVDTSTGAATMVKSNDPKFDGANEVVEQRFATSADGTRVPYFLVRSKTMKFDGSTPTLLYGYGGFGVSLTPEYDGVVGKLWLERGGAYVLANIRGGGELGPAWHDAAVKTHRQRSYDDFAAIATDLIAKGITSPRRLGIWGGSNGGLLVGVEMVQHPELWNAVDMEVPLLDMLRFEKIEAGASWTGEYGSVSKPDERAFLAAISPYANVKSGVAYPQPLIWTTTNDDRVGPQHARKFAAKLASLGVPYLYFEVGEGGHGAGADAQEQAFTTALEMTYFARKLW